MAKLVAPTAVGVVLADDKSSVTVKWIDDGNKPEDVKDYVVSFRKKDTQELYKPQSGTSQEKSIVITPTEPTATDLYNLYLAQVVAESQSDPQNNSDPGYQIYWDCNVTLTLEVGSKTFVLSQADVMSGIYRLPCSRQSPITITLDDIKSFAKSVGISETNIPKKWPNGTDITGSLNLYRLALDINNGLFALDIAFDLEWTVITGLTIKEVGLTVLRTDGIHPL